MNGWKVVAAATALLLVHFGAVVAIHGTDEEGLRVLVRATARISFLFFLPVYVASSARRLWPGTATRWMLRNRRYLGLSFFVAHVLHLDAIVLLDTLLGDAFRADLSALLGGGLAYVLVTAMALTSSDRAVRWLGPRRWGLLHRVGLHYIFAIWVFQWTTAAVLVGPVYWLPTLVAFGALGIRIAARRSRTASQPAAAAAT